MAVATHLADISVLARLHHDDVAARVSPMFLGGRIATCAIVDLELLATARDGSDHEELWFERQLLPRAAMTEATANRAIEVQGELARASQHRRTPITVLLLAACAEAAGLVVLHYDRDVDRIAAVTGQPTEWVVPAGTVP